MAKATVNDVFNITEGDEDQLTLSIAYFNPVSIAFEVKSLEINFLIKDYLLREIRHLK